MVSAAKQSGTPGQMLFWAHHIPKLHNRNSGNLMGLSQTFITPRNRAIFEKKSQHFIPEHRGVDHTLVSCNIGWEKVSMPSLLCEEGCFDEAKAMVGEQAFASPWSSQHFAQCHSL